MLRRNKMRLDFRSSGPRLRTVNPPVPADSPTATLAGGPFVTSPTGGDTQDHEPRLREME